MAETEEVGRYASRATLRHHRDHAAIQIAPRGFTVQAKERAFSVSGPQILVMRSGPLVAPQAVHIVRRIRKIGKTAEAIVPSPTPASLAA